MTTFFTSDTHFGHANIIKYCNRLFGCTREMDEELIRNWNMEVKPEDTVYHLGDVAWKGSSLRDCASKLNGRKILLLGNHDNYKIAKYEEFFEEVHEHPIEVEIDGTELRLCHYPRQHALDKFTLCGHVHEKWKIQWNMLNVGVDVFEMTPVSIDEVREWIEHQRVRGDEDDYPYGPPGYQPKPGRTRKSK